MNKEISEFFLRENVMNFIGISLFLVMGISLFLLFFLFFNPRGFFSWVDKLIPSFEKPFFFIWIGSLSLVAILLLSEYFAIEYHILSVKDPVARESLLNEYGRVDLALKDEDKGIRERARKNNGYIKHIY